MFVCADCLSPHWAPPVSFGRCEECGEVRACADVSPELVPKPVLIGEDGRPCQNS